LLRLPRLVMIWMVFRARLSRRWPVRRLVRFFGWGQVLAGGRKGPWGAV